MNAMVVWLMVIAGTGGNYSVGPEFTTKEKCEVAAEAVHKGVDGLRWSAVVRRPVPVCIRIEK